MSTLRDELLPLVDDARKICDDFGLRQNKVRLVFRTYASGDIGDGVSTTVETLLVPTPKVRALSAKEISSSGGRFEQGDMMVGPITPQHVAGGYTIEQLDRETLAEGGVEVLFRLVGPNAGEYILSELRRDRPMRYEAVIRRTRRTPG